MLVPNDTMYAQQWHYFEAAGGIDLPRAWDITTGSASITIAVIDTGVSRHPRLPNLVPGGDYVSTGDGMQDCDAHGTMVAGILSGVAPDVSGNLTDNQQT